MSNDKKGSKRKKFLIIVFVVFTFIVIIGGGGIYYTGSNNFCGSCHQMKTRYALWEKSTHNQVKCVTCHSEPGLVGEFKAHIEGTKYLESFLKGKTSHITIFAKLKNPARLKSCIQCHPADTLINETEALRINHASHVVRDRFLCTDCHADIVHSAFSFEKIRPKEEKCIACHLREGARLNCQGCHIKKVDKRSRQLYVLEVLKELEDD